MLHPVRKSEVKFNNEAFPNWYEFSEPHRPSLIAWFAWYACARSPVNQPHKPSRQSLRVCSSATLLIFEPETHVKFWHSIHKILLYDAEPTITRP